ncbi:MAG: astroprincin family protein [Bacteroidia bacterium]
MKVTHIFPFAFAIWILLTFSTCREKELPFDDSMTSKLVKASVAGRVYIDEQTPASYAEVRLSDGSVTKADVNGNFFFYDVTLKAPYSYVKVSNDRDFFSASRTFWVQENSVNYVKIKLLPKAIQGYISATEGGTVEIEGASVSLPPNGVMYDNGSPYSGEIMVVGRYLSPNAADLQEIMPGALLGYDEKNTRHLLQTFGMIAVELFDQDGLPLQVAAGKKATIALPAVPNLSHEGEMPLWYFDTKIGFWEKEGFATLQNGKWVGEVSHFSFWNCDVPTQQGTIKLRVVNSNGTPIPNVTVFLGSANYGTTSGVTNSEGVVQGIVPANQSLTLSSMSICGAWTYPSPIQTTTGNLDLGNIVVSTYGGETHLVGKIINCNGDPLALTNGMLTVQEEGSNYYIYMPINSSDIDVYVPYCGTSTQVSVKANNFSTMLASNSIEVTLQNGTIDIGNVTICGNNIGDTNEYFDYEIDGNLYHVTQEGITCNVSDNSAFPGSTILISMDNSVMVGNLMIGFKPNQSAYYITTNNLPNTFMDYLSGTLVNITHLAQVQGEYLDGNFTKTYTDSTGTHSVVCNFHVLRDN